MNELLETSVFFGVWVTLLAYLLGRVVQKKWKLVMFNPLLLAIVLVIVILLLTDTSYHVYYEGAKYISYLMTPATICLAVPLYEQVELLKKHHTALLLGILAGVLTSLCSILACGILFGLEHGAYVTLLPKSITTPIGLSVSEELGGYPSITVAVIIITGLLGNMFGETACKLFRITEPIAKGVAMGASAHVMGTAKAMEMGEVEGAMSSLSIVVSGIFTVLGAALFAMFL